MPEPTTLAEFLQKYVPDSTGNNAPVELWFDDPKDPAKHYDKMTGDYSSGDYEVTASMLESAENLGQQVLDLG